MKEKILKILRNIKNFSLLDYLLFRKMYKIDKSIDLKVGLIDYHMVLIKDAESQIAGSMQVIADLKSDILGLKKKIDDIEKI